MTGTRVLIADDHPLLRQGLRRALELAEDVEVVGEAVSGEDCLALVERLRPDVLLLDITMPGPSGIEVAQRVRERYPETKILILTIHDTEDYLLEAVRIGVNGYVLKDVEPEGLLRAIRACRAGETFLQPALAGRLMAGVARREQERRAPPPQEILTERELQVLQLLAQGASNREIGARLFISEKTVKNHATSIFRKLEVSDRTQAVIQAVRRGWVKL